MLATPDFDGCNAVSGENATILVVDDDAEVREVVAEYLMDSGHRVLQAAGGVEALRVLDRAPDIDLVITDVRMPDISGIDLAERITREIPSPRIILISGYFVPQQVNRRVLRKPFRMQELEEAIRAELASR
ncbi:MAG: response regulator [Acetobacteraceae bacterium]|nr:response regulator [Acetobacteraceae bacterium]MBV9775488.1 response regulator [Acetobacteraceae bacterium]